MPHVSMPHFHQHGAQKASAEEHPSTPVMLQVKQPEKIAEKQPQNQQQKPICSDSQQYVWNLRDDEVDGLVQAALDGKRKILI